MSAPSAIDRDCVQFTAYGVPVSQGSLRSLGQGRPTIHSNQAALLPWRQVVATAATEVMGEPPWSGPVKVTILFTLPRPKSAKVGALPTTRRLDIDKGARAVLDAITHVVVDDDSQVVALEAVKVYEGDRLALIRPGVTVHVRRIG